MIECLLAILYILLIILVPIYLLAVFITLVFWRREIDDARTIIKGRECPRKIALLQERGAQEAASAKSYEDVIRENGRLSRLIARNRRVFDNIYKIDKKVKSGKLSFRQLNTAEEEFNSIVKWGEKNFPRRRG